MKDKKEIEQLADKIIKDKGYNFDYLLGENQVKELLVTMYQQSQSASIEQAVDIALNMASEIAFDAVNWNNQSASGLEQSIISLLPKVLEQLKSKENEN